MVESLKRGYAFMIEAWRMARADPDLLKPSLYTLLAGLVVTPIGFVPMALSVYFLSERTYGQVVTGFFAALLFCALVAVGYLFSAMTVYLAFGYLAEGDGRLDRARALLRSRWQDILGLAGAELVTGLLGPVITRKRSRTGDPQAAIWDEDAEVALPILVIESLGLKEVLARVDQISRGRLLNPEAHQVGVRLVATAIDLVLGGVGIVGGTFLSVSLIRASNGAAAGVIGGLGAGVLVTSLFILAAVVVAAYAGAVYRTCLYLWARDAGLAQHEGQDQEVSAPAPLASALAPHLKSVEAQ
ncbi:MAG TPA: hypothetical protein VMT46_05730 [Anaerolineaceae bacterium]|nr:hypothetical protein [Anaerolineaceae bacterium]